MSKKSRRYKEHAKKRGGGGFVALPHAVLRSKEFADLSPIAVKLLMDMLAQYNGRNNGELVMYWSKMSVERRWKSKETLFKALAELRETGFLELTRLGTRTKIPSLYATSFYAIDHCDGKLEVSPTGSPSGAWHRPIVPGADKAPAAPPTSSPKVAVQYRRPKLSRVRQADLSEENRSDPRTSAGPASGNRYGRRTYSDPSGVSSGTKSVLLSRFTTTSDGPSKVTHAEQGVDTTPQSTPIPVEAAPSDARVIAYQEILARARTSKASRRSRRIGKAHLQDPNWRFSVALLSEGAGLAEKEVANLLGRYVSRFGWQVVWQAVQESVELKLWGMGAVRYVEGSIPFAALADARSEQEAGHAAS